MVKYIMSDINEKLLNKKIKKISRIKEKKLKLIIYGNPLSSKRPRTGRFGNFYVPDAAKNKKKIREAIIGQLKDFDLKNDIIYTDFKFKINVYLPIPKNFSLIDKELAELKYIKPIIKPDTDNILKTYLDALNKYLFYDDSQCISSICNKYYSKNPRVIIIIIYKDDFSSTFFNTRSKKLKVNFINNKSLNRKKK